MNADEETGRGTDKRQQKHTEVYIPGISLKNSVSSTAASSKLA